ncbi:MAG: CBS domain-containing protein [Deltaproteobacteria bacterium]|nr:CBS domain-containing protein [Deltaproteobacteria bacterium]
MPSIADIVPLTEIMTRDMTVVRADLSVRHLPDLIARHRIGCVPVVDERGRPIGMITKTDVIAHLITPQGELPRIAGEVMLPITIAVSERATIAHAASLMSAEDIHHLLVVDLDGVLTGVVSTLDIVRWLARNDGFAP